jgi:hypothetical protein
VSKDWFQVVRTERSSAAAWPTPKFVFLTCYLGMMALGFPSLAVNNLWSADVEVRRKTKVILWGTAIGVGPVFFLGRH